MLKLFLIHPATCSAWIQNSCVFEDPSWIIYWSLFFFSAWKAAFCPFPLPPLLRDLVRNSRETVATVLIISNFSSHKTLKHGVILRCIQVYLDFKCRGFLLLLSSEDYKKNCSFLKVFVSCFIWSFCLTPADPWPGLHLVVWGVLFLEARKKEIWKDWYLRYLPSQEFLLPGAF